MQIILSAINPLVQMPTILQIADADRNISTLMKGLKAANLEETLNGIGSFTILAPVNLAFGNLNTPETFDNLDDQTKKTAGFLIY